MIIALPQAARAQDARAAADAAESGDIVVTAQKRTERLVDVPMAVSAISSETLTSQNLVTLRDFFAKVPGLSYNGGAGLQNLAIRGVTTGGGGNPTVAVTIDDVPFSPATFVGYGARRSPDLDPSDLERIEVLRGPQGTLYGASSLGGLIKYVTKAPETDRWHVRGEAGGTSVSHGEEGYSVRGSVNAPIVDEHVALRVSGFYRRDAGFIDHVKDPVTGFGNEFKDSNSTTTKGGRAALLLKSGNVSATLSAMLQKVEGWDAPTIEYTPTFGFRSRDLAYSGGLKRTPYSNTNRLFTGTVNVDLGFADLVSVTAYGYTRYFSAQDTTATYATLIPTYGFPVGSASTLTNRFSTRKFTQEVRLGEEDGQGLDWLIGGFYMREKSKSPQTLDAQDPTSGAVIGNVATFLTSGAIREYAGFADLTYHFSDAFDVQGGIRFSHNSQTYDDIGDGPLNGGRTVTHNESSESPITWLLSPRFHLNRDAMIYARVSTGYRTGGPNTGLAGIPATFDADRTTNYELGYKMTTADRRLTFDGALYWIAWNKVQLQLSDPATNFLYLTNGAKARSRGYEGTVEWKVTPTTRIALNGAYNDAKLTEDVPLTANVRAVKGDRLPFSSKWSGNASIDQDIPLTDDLTATIGGTATYVGARPQTFAPRRPATTPRLTAPAYTTFDLRAGLRYEAFTLNAFITNLTDKRGWTGIALRSNANLAAGYNASVINPRTFGLSLGFTY